MAGVHQLAQAGEVAVAHGADGFEGAVVLGDDVTGTAAGDGVEVGGASLEVRDVHVAECGNAEEARRGLALLAAMAAGYLRGV